MSINCPNKSSRVTSGDSRFGGLLTEPRLQLVTITQVPHNNELSVGSGKPCHMQLIMHMSHEAIGSDKSGSERAGTEGAKIREMPNKEIYPMCC